MSITNNYRERLFTTTSGGARLSWVLSLVVGLLVATPLQAVNLYVDSSAALGGDGTSWNSAFRYLQDALDQTVAGRGDEVWIAAGTYYPDEGENVTDGDRTASFYLKKNVSLYGGFAGGESSLEERDWDANETVLSGEIDEEQQFWSLHVCTAEDSVTLDGLTVTGGNANGSSSPSDSAGGVKMTSWSASIGVSNCRFTNNSAAYVGGVADTGDWTVTNSTFSGNSAEHGGVASGGHWTVTKSTFRENVGQRYGGVATGGDWTVTSCTFEGNSAAGRGGVATGNWTVTNCTFRGNSANVGGVASTGFSTSPRRTWTVTNSTFSGNSAEQSGGVAAETTLTAKRTVTTNNQKPDSRRASIVSFRSSLTKVNRNFSFENSAEPLSIS